MEKNVKEIEELILQFDVARMFLAEEASIVVSLRDITERKKAEEKLRGYQLIVESIQDAIFIKDLNSRYISANQKTLEALGGLTQEEALGKTDNELLSPEEARVNIEDDQRVFKTGRPVEIIKKMTATGKEVYFQAVKVPLRDEKGNIIGLIGVARAITERLPAGQTGEVLLR